MVTDLQTMTHKSSSCRYNCTATPEKNRKSICLLSTGLMATLGVAISALLRTEKNANDIAALAAELNEFQVRIQKEIEDITPPVGTIISILPTDEPIGGIYYPFDGVQAETFWYQLCVTPCPRPPPEPFTPPYTQVCNALDCWCDTKKCCELPCGRCDPRCPEPEVEDEGVALQQLIDGSRQSSDTRCCDEECNLTELWEALGRPELVIGTDANSYFQILNDGVGGVAAEKTGIIVVGSCSCVFVYCRTYDPVTGESVFTPHLRPQEADICV